MKAVMYGGGNIGRGFIGTLFSASGFETVFVDVVDAVVNTLNSEQRLIYNTCEDAYLLLDGETINFYYRAGFSDAIRFLFGWTDIAQWRDGRWN